jgi:intracellular septation protein
MPDQKSSSPAPKKDGSRLLLEFGPLILFFVVNAKFGIYWGTAALVLSTVIALIVFWVRDRYIPKLLAFGCAGVVLFGALTLAFNDDTFIKIKPTVVSLIFVAGLLVGHFMGRNPLKAIMGGAMALNLPDRAWRKLTLIWVVMFSTIAAANEIAWRSLSTDGWVTFKVFGLTGISLFFGVVIAVFLNRYTSSGSDTAG